MAIIVNSIIGILAMVAVGLCMESVYRQRKMNQLKTEATCKKKIVCCGELLSFKRIGYYGVFIYRE
jgi:hypothetical protein